MGRVERGGHATERDVGQDDGAWGLDIEAEGAVRYLARAAIATSPSIRQRCMRKRPSRMELFAPATRIIAAVERGRPSLKFSQTNWPVLPQRPRDTA